jgi:hypothetical protein
LLPFSLIFVVVSVQQRAGLGSRIELFLPRQVAFELLRSGNALRLLFALLPCPHLLRQIEERSNMKARQHKIKHRNPKSYRDNQDFWTENKEQRTSA